MIFRTAILSALFILIALPIYTLAQDTSSVLSCGESQKLGEQDALKEDSPEWTFYGCIGGIYPVAIASSGYYLPPSIPDNVNIECYKYGYMKAAQTKRAKHAMNGCLVTTFSVIGVAILVAFNTLN